MKKAKSIHSMIIILMASLGLASMGCFSFLASDEPAGTRVAAAGVDVITAPVQIVVIGIVLFGGLIAEIPMPASQAVEDDSSAVESPVAAEGQ